MNLLKTQAKIGTQTEVLSEGCLLIGFLIGAALPTVYGAYLIFDTVTLQPLKNGEARDGTAVAVGLLLIVVLGPIAGFVIATVFGVLRLVFVFRNDQK